VPAGNLRGFTLIVVFDDTSIFYVFARLSRLAEVANASRNAKEAASSGGGARTGEQAADVVGALEEDPDTGACTLPAPLRDFILSDRLDLAERPVGDSRRASANAATSAGGAAAAEQAKRAGLVLIVRGAVTAEDAAEQQEQQQGESAINARMQSGVGSSDISMLAGERGLVGVSRAQYSG
jgi:hypothetical protein